MKRYGSSTAQPSAALIRVQERGASGPGAPLKCGPTVPSIGEKAVTCAHGPASVLARSSVKECEPHSKNHVPFGCSAGAGLLQAVRKRYSFLNFPYVCPEPVLVKWSFLV